MSNCKQCGQEITWKTPYQKGDGPLNPDSSPHRCKKQEPRSPNQPDTVKWEEILDEEITSDMSELMIGLETMRKLAYKDARKTHPDMATNGNTFGTIVNANITHLINLAMIKAVKNKK